MYLIINYDVKDKRCVKLMKFLRRFLYHLQESVFVGEATEKTYKMIVKGIESITDKQYDKVIIYKMRSAKVFKIETLGKQKWIENII